MAYASLADATDLYGQDYVLTSVDRDADGNADAAATTAALSQASSLIDSYLAAKYTVPISPVPDLLVKYTVDIAIYECCPASTRTDEKRQRYEDALAWLKDVAKGIAVVAPPDAGDEAIHLPSAVSQPRLFTRPKMQGLM